MNFFDLVNISEQNMKLLNPMYKNKLERLGQILELSTEKQVLDLACGFGELLAIWGSKFGTKGTGVEIREFACEKARKRIEKLNLEEIDIICENASYYQTNQLYDVVSIVGASFIYGGFQNSIKKAMSMMKTDGRLIIGEPYLIKNPKTEEAEQFVREEELVSEYEQLTILREEGYELEYMVRSSRDEWDYYKAENWKGLNTWLTENKHHREWEEVHHYLRKNQDEYFKFGREYMGWAIYVLRRQ